MEKVELNKVLQNFYQNKRVFLTGHTGFKGAWLLCWLKQLGCDVKGYSLEPESYKSLFNTVKDKLVF